MTQSGVAHFCTPVIHPDKKEVITKYKKIANNPTLHNIWTAAFGKEFRNLAQWDTQTGTKGTNAIFIMDSTKVQRIQRNRTVTYARIVADYRPQKNDPNRVRIAAGGNLLMYPEELSTQTSDLITTKILWNSVLSTKGAKFMAINMKNICLGTPMD